MICKPSAAVTHIVKPHKPTLNQSLPKSVSAQREKEIFKNAPRTTKKKEEVFQNDIREGGY